jgi:uncharacterized oligopeptide transporter (OPT) family protein
MDVFHLWNKEPGREIPGIKGYEKAVVSGEVSPALLGVGYIIGLRTSCIMVGGGILAALVLTPSIAFFGSGSETKILAPGTIPISQMSVGQIWASYVRYIGAGAVSAGGIISMVRALPMILGGLAGSFRALGSKGSAASDSDSARTNRDMPFAVVIFGSLALIGAIASTDLIPTDTTGRIAGAVMILLFGFLFVTVSSRLTGVIGSSSNPISGMTIATLLLTCLIFVLLSWTGPQYRVTALSIAAIVCIASSNGGTTSQDLKTGFLVGGTPWKQQVAILIGALASAFVIGFTLLLLNHVYTDITSDPEYLPRISTPPESLASLPEETFEGKTYKVWWIKEAGENAKPGRYYVDPVSGAPKFRVDPGIGGIVTRRADKSEATKFNPPQPALFAVIIDGIMSGKLPWVLVVLGAFLAVVVQLTGVSSLAFAVGVYLPLSTTLPIFLGGLVRGAVDRSRKSTPEESDSSPAVLMASGLIAGGSIAGILIALSTVLMPNATYFVTSDLPEASAPDVDRLPDAPSSPDSHKYKLWTRSGGEEYLVNPEGRPVYRQEVGSVLDLRRRFFPSAPENLLWPSLTAFSVLILSLLWVGLRAPSPSERAAEMPDADLSKEGEISSGQDDLA